MEANDVNVLLSTAEIGSVPELDLHGENAANAAHAIDAFLHGNWMKRERSVRIIHGNGSGTLRKAVLLAVRDHALVAGYRVHESGGSMAVALIAK